MTHVRPYEAIGALCNCVIYGLNVESAFIRVWGEQDKTRKLTDEDKQDIFKLYEEGEMMKDIARMYGVSLSYISYIIKANGGGKDRKSYPKEMQDKVMDLHSQNIKQCVIAEMCGVHPTFVNNTIRKYSQKKLEGKQC